MKFLKKTNFEILITLVFVSALAAYFLKNQNALKELASVSIFALLLLMILKASRIFANGLFTKFTLKTFNKDISIAETNLLSLLSSLGNFFGPILGGASIRAIYLKKKHNFLYSNFISTLYGYFAISFLSNTFIGLLLLIAYIGNNAADKNAVTILLVLLFIFFGSLMLIVTPTKYTTRFLEKQSFLPARLVRILNNFTEGWDKVRKDRKLLTKLILLNFATFFIAVVEAYILYKLFVHEFTLTSVFLYTLLGSLTVLINFTPGAIGVKEAVYLFSSSVIAIAPEQILQMAAIDRSATFVLLGSMFIITKALRLEKNVSNNE